MGSEVNRGEEQQEPAKEKRTERLNIPVTPSELKAFKAAAERLGMMDAQWARYVLRPAAGLGADGKGAESHG